MGDFTTFLRVVLLRLQPRAGLSLAYGSDFITCIQPPILILCSKELNKASINVLIADSLFPKVVIIVSIENQVIKLLYI